ncbi:MAG: MgtC/SapB family protein [Chloroflexi bacterium]|nr:MgtC/SapB family protein [Chloroflexota bacterium]
MINQPLTLLDVLLRIGAALLAGFILGLERESRGRAAGLRTYILVCCASAIAMIVALFFFTDASATIPNLGWRPDPNRMAQGILAGMGFLGAGTILRRGKLIHGLTTAAGLWFVTVIGIALGSGYLLLGGIGIFIALFTLRVLPLFEKHIPNDRYATLLLSVHMDSVTPDDYRREIESNDIRVIRAEIEYDLAQQQEMIRYEVHYKGKDAYIVSFPQTVLDRLSQHSGVLQLKWIQQGSGAGE